MNADVAIDNRVYPGGIHISLHGSSEGELARRFLERLPTGTRARAGGIDGVVVVSKGVDDARSEWGARTIFFVYSVNEGYFCLDDGTYIGREVDGVDPDWRRLLGCDELGRRVASA